MGNVQSTPMLRTLLWKSRFKTQGRFSFLLPWLVISSFVQFSEEDFGSLTVCALKISCSTHTYACHGVCTWKIIPKSDILPWLFLFSEDLTGAQLRGLENETLLQFVPKGIFILFASLPSQSRLRLFDTLHIFFRNAYTPILRGCHGCRVWNS